MIRRGALPILMLGLIHAGASACALHGAQASNPVLEIAFPARQGEPEWIAQLPQGLRIKARRLQETPASEPAAQEAPLSPEQKRHQADIERDEKIGADIAKEVEKYYKFSENKEMLERIDRLSKVFSKIARENRVETTWGDERLNVFDYKFYVLKGEEVNAFSVAGGYIYFYEGLIKYCETDHELAGVMAHEISHASMRHVATLEKEQSKLSAITLPLILISLIAGGEAGAGVAQIGALTNQAVGSGWSVKAELAADYGGFQYMKKSPYSPIGLLTFMERLAFEERVVGRVDWGIYRTHPPSRDRVASLTGYLRGAEMPIKRSVSSTSFRVLIEDREQGAHALKLFNREIVTFRGEGAKERAQKEAERLTSFMDEVPRVYDIEAGRDGNVLGKRSPILTLQTSDLTEGQTMDQAVRSAVNAIKAAAFDMSYRIWDN